MVDYGLHLYFKGVVEKIAGEEFVEHECSVSTTDVKWVPNIKYFNNQNVKTRKEGLRKLIYEQQVSVNLKGDSTFINDTNKHSIPQSRIVWQKQRLIVPVGLIPIDYGLLHHSNILTTMQQLDRRAPKLHTPVYTHRHSPGVLQLSVLTETAATVFEKNPHILQNTFSIGG